jgi:hypothetical protein
LYRPSPNCSQLTIEGVYITRFRTGWFDPAKIAQDTAVFGFDL